MDPQETVVQTDRVSVVTRNSPRVIDALRKDPPARTPGRAGSIERSELAARTAYKTVDNGLRVSVVSRDSPLCIDAFRKGSVASTWIGARARSIKRGEFTPGAAQETVVQASRVSVASCDSPRIVDVFRERPVA
jgi:hypothetical protein